MISEKEKSDLDKVTHAVVDMDLPGMEAAIEPASYEEGDIFCEDDGEYIGAYQPVKDSTGTIPIEVSLYHKGKWFIYKLDRKEEQE